MSVLNVIPLRYYQKYVYCSNQPSFMSLNSLYCNTFKLCISAENDREVLSRKPTPLFHHRHRYWTSLLACYSRSINFPSNCLQLSTIQTVWFRRRIGTTVPATVVLIHYSCCASNLRFTSKCKVNAWIFQLAFLSMSANKSKKKCSNINHFGSSVNCMIISTLTGKSKSFFLATKWMYCWWCYCCGRQNIQTHAQKTSHNLLFYLLYINGINPIHSFYACSLTHAPVDISEIRIHIAFFRLLNYSYFYSPISITNTIDETMDHSLLSLIEYITAHSRLSEEKLRQFFPQWSVRDGIKSFSYHSFSIFLLSLAPINLIHLYSTYILCDTIYTLTFPLPLHSSLGLF